MVRVKIVLELLAALPLATGNASIVESSIEIHQISDVNFDSQTIDVVFTTEQWIKGVNSTLIRHEIAKKDQVYEPLSQISPQVLENIELEPTHIAILGMSVVGRLSKHKVKTSCHFSDAFPFDRQTCDVCFLSTKHAKDDTILQWSRSEPVTVNSRIQVPFFKLKKIISYERLHKVVLPSQKSALSLQRNHSECCIEIQLQRLLHIIIIRFFLPSVFLLSVCNVVFYLPRRRVTVRLLTLLLSFVAQIILSSSVLSKPVSSTFQPIDIWTGLLIVHYFIFFFMETLIQSADQSYTKCRSLLEDDYSVREKSRVKHMRVVSRDLLHNNSKATDSAKGPTDNVFSLKFRRRMDSASLTAARIQIFVRLFCPLFHALTFSLYFSYFSLQNNH